MASHSSSPGGHPGLPISLIVWGAIGIALNVGIARFTYGVILPSLRRDLGVDNLAGGSLNAIHLAGYLIGTLVAPTLARRTGMPRLAMGAHLLVAAGALICAAAPSNAAGLAILTFGRVATGLGAGAGIVAILVLVFAAVPAQSRAFVSAAVWSGMGVAVIASGLALSWLSEPQIGWRATFAIAAAIAIGLVLTSPRVPSSIALTATSITGSGGFAARQLASRRWIFLTLGYLLFGIGYIAYSTFAGVRLAATQASVTLIGAAWTAFGFAAMVGAALTVVLLNAPRLKQFALIAALASGALGALIAVSDATVAALAGPLLVGLGLAATPSIVSAHIRDRCDADEYPAAFSLVSAALGLGQLVGPVAAGALADIFGAAIVPLFAASAYAAAAGFALLDIRWAVERKVIAGAPNDLRR